ncbi:MAG TPA: 3-phosphoshikimate 1-carboxyvinyltransferase [Stellaceae bacterium]|nr:3-phosphoshikimate 1-carboxyvinyltransferase [Stellaceae bacterium]
MTNATGAPLVARCSGPLKGRCRVPGDKSLSHRALILGGLAVGRTRVKGLLEGEDVLCTAAAMRALGAGIEREAEGEWRIDGRGVGGLAEPDSVLDLGNSGTGARLLMGAVAGHPFTSFFTGDASLRRRPMARVATPLTQMGARIVTREGGRMPLAVVGATTPIPISYRMPVASAQVKSAVLLAGLHAPGETIVEEPLPSRDHTERLMRHFGASLVVEPTNAGGRRIRLSGQPELAGADLVVPGDPSSAAFPAVAALLVPGSAIVIEGVGLNPLRAGLYQTLSEMGAEIGFANRRIAGGEPVADLEVRASRLKGVVVPAERAPSMIDEYPVLAVAAAFAEGRTVMHGLAELRVKESDRLAGIAEGLTACGSDVAIDGDTLIVAGGRPPVGGGSIAARLDHRIAMAFLVLGLASERGVRIDDGATIATSFPDFVTLMTGLGATIAAEAA